MIDIHTHILPNIDDGADDYEEACVMAEMAVRSGVTALVATPHSTGEYNLYNKDVVMVRRKYEKLRTILQSEKINLELYMGMEVWASTDIAEKILTRQLFTINGSRYVLVEFGFDEEPWWFDAVIQELVKNHLVPIIAHPERYFCVQDIPELVYEWCLAGAYAQMNKGSILGRFGNSVAYTAEKLLNKELYSFIASDAHHCDVRTTDMTKIQRYFKRKYDENYWNELIYQNPLAVLQNRAVCNRGLSKFWDK